MDELRYEIFLLQQDVYWFVSTGKFGDIYKAVLFQKLPANNRFNLAMGDIDMETALMEFDKLSGNGDVRRVFATIGDIVEHYTSIYPDRQIFVAANTDEKSRSYSLMNSRFLDEVLVNFYVWGASDGGEFNLFEKGKIYDAILLERK